MLDVIVDEFALRVRDGAFDGMKLLCKIEAASTVRHHLQYPAQMSFGAFQSLDDGGVTGVDHRALPILQGRIPIGPATFKLAACSIIS